MFQQIQIHDWVIEVDREATAKANESAPVVWPDGCPCNTCQNFVVAAPFIPEEFRQVCSVLGVNPLKPVEASEIIKWRDGSHFYMGWFHIVGRIVSAPAPLEQTSVDHIVSGEYYISFTEDAALVSEGFPSPILQFNFQFDLPWVLALELDTTPDFTD